MNAVRQSWRSWIDDLQNRSADGRLVIFVLEDDEVDAEILHRSLCRSWAAGVEITVFTLLADIEAALQATTPDVVFCDMSLPDGVGIAVVERVVVAANAVPVVVLTSSPDPGAAELALRVGAQDFLQKGSFDGEILARTLRYSLARNAAEIENRRISRDLAQLHDELDQYVGVVAHDLRAPVRTARLFADRLVAAVERGEDPSVVAGALDSSLERLELLINRLLRLGSLRDSELDPVTESLAAVVDDVRAALLPRLLADRATLRCADDEAILADPQLIRELLESLVQNSIDYRHPDRDPVVVVSAVHSGAWSRVTVTDNGRGIDSGQWQQALRLFERLDTGNAKPGLGFGLAFCRRVAELHRGSLEFVEPADGVGAAVQVTLPRRRSGGPRHRPRCGE